MKIRKLLLWSVILCCAGLFVAGFLSYAHVAGITVPCRMSGEGCNVIQNHPSSKWFDIPVAYFGFGAYLAVLATSIATLFGFGGNAPQKIGFAISVAGALVSIGLQLYGALIIKATCDWCLASAAIMCALALVNAVVMQNKGEEPSSANRGKMDIGIVAVMLAGCAISLGLITASNKASQGTTLDDTRIGAVDPMKYLTDGAPTIGPDDAPITIVEFADLFCGSCRISFGHMKKLQATYPGKIKWVFRHFPLFTKKGHELALPTAVVAEYCSKQGKFWEFIGAIFSMSDDSLKSMSDIYMVAANVNVDTKAVTTSIENQDSPELARVTEDINIANKIGIAETPTFILLVKGSKPVALRMKDLDARLNSSEMQALLKGNGN